MKFEMVENGSDNIAALHTHLPDIQRYRTMRWPGVRAAPQVGT